MRQVDRSDVPPPHCLEAVDGIGRQEQVAARMHQQSTQADKGSFTYKAYKHDQVKHALTSLFHGKCAYCETFYSASAPVDIEHYRPKAEVSEAPQHPGYWWLAMQWDNLLPSCIDCNRRRKQHVPAASTSLQALYDNQTRLTLGTASLGKKDSFPLADESQRLAAESYEHALEGALLLDPTRHDPRAHLRFHTDDTSPISLVVPSSEVGAVSIHTYGLNRLGLVQERTRLLRQLEFLGFMIVELNSILERLETEHSPVVQEVIPRMRRLLALTYDEIHRLAKPEQPYSEMVRTWIDSFTEKLLNP